MLMELQQCCIYSKYKKKKQYWKMPKQQFFDLIKFLKSCTTFFGNGANK